MNESVWNGIARLRDFACIRVSGADASAFLQAQLTSDFSALPDDRARLAGFCSAKGRLQASFVGWKQGPADVVLLCAADLLAPTLKRLSMFVLRMKCRLSDLSDEMSVFGVAGSCVDALLPGASAWQRRDDPAGTAIRLPAPAGQKLAFWLPQRAAEGVDGPSSLPPISAETWRWLQVCSGIPFVQAKTADMFVPQMINFELLGGVDFQKGCYPGQEVVARSQYRGSLKRRMFLFDCETPASAGDEVFSAEDAGQPAGMVVNAAAQPQGRGSALLVEVKLAELQRGALHLGEPGGPNLVRRELPYPLPLSGNQSP
jgi:tRNA-modifying protein YgfZ